MSKERELLLVALDFLDPRRWLDPSDQHALNVITRDIELLLTQPEQAEQEPVAWMYEWTNEIGELIKGVYVGSHKASHLYELENLQPLYLAPPKREPLSDAQIAELWGDKHSGKTYMVKNFARAIEQAHGIGGGE